MQKIKGTNNGYRLDESSTNKKLWEICKTYDKVRCIICNSNTSKRFHVPLLGDNHITVNNTLSDGIVYINKIS